MPDIAAGRSGALTVPLQLRFGLPGRAAHALEASLESEEAAQEVGGYDFLSS